MLARHTERVRRGDEAGIRAAVQRPAQFDGDSYRGVRAHTEATVFFGHANADDADVTQRSPGTSPILVGSRRPGGGTAEAAAYRIAQLPDVVVPAVSHGTHHTRFRGRVRIRGST